MSGGTNSTPDADDRAAVYEEDGKVIYRASAFGGCLTALAALRSGYEPSPPPEKMVEGPFKRGHTLEEKAVKALKEMGWAVRDRQKEFDLALTSRARVRAHVDGIAESLVVEVKSQSKEEYEKWDRESPWAEGHWQRYAWQVSAMMLATGLHCAVVRITPDLEMDRLIVKEPPHSLKELRERHFAVEKLVRSGNLLCTTPMFPCPVWRIHPDNKLEPIDLDDEGIDEHAKIYDHCRKELSKWKEIQEAARRALRIGITADRVRTKSGIIVSFIPTKRRVLSKKLLEEHGLTEEDVTTEEVGERIDVKGVPTKEREDAREEV